MNIMDDDIKMQIIDGKKTAADIREELKEKLVNLKDEK